MRTALVLSGGGAKGAFEAGVIAGLDELGIRPTVLSGTSAGALNAAALAVGLGADEIVELWSNLESRDVYRLRHDVHRLIRPLHFARHPRRILGLGTRTTTEHLLDSIGWTWLFETSPLRRKLVDVLGGETLTVRDDVVLTVSCLEASTGELIRFTNTPPPEGRGNDAAVQAEMTVDHLLASAAIPGLFAPVEIDGRTYWDGGLIANTPLTGAVAHEPDRAIVVASGAVDRDHEVPQSLGEVVSLGVDHLLRFALLKDLDHTETVNRLVAAAPDATKHRTIDLVPIVPDEATPGVGALMDFEPERARELIAAGREAALRSFDDHDPEHGTQAAHDRIDPG